MAIDTTGWSAADKNMSVEDQEKINQYKQAYANSTNASDKQYWNDQANKLRENYGYVGGTNGVTYSPLSNYQKANIALDNVTNKQPFTYNPDTDQAYQAYLQQYQRAGTSAMQNALAQSASATGGIGSTYANAVANQAAQQYAKKATDMIPTMIEQSYGRYRDDINDQFQLYNSNYNAYQDERDYNYQQQQQAYENYLNLLNLAENTRQFDVSTRGMLSDAYGNYMRSANDQLNMSAASEANRTGSDNTSNNEYYGQLSASDRRLPVQAQRIIANAKEQYAMATNLTDKQYWHSVAENARRQYAV